MGCGLASYYDIINMINTVIILIHYYVFIKNDGKISPQPLPNVIILYFYLLLNENNYPQTLTHCRKVKEAAVAWRTIRVEEEGRRGPTHEISGRGLSVMRGMRMGAVRPISWSYWER